MIKKKHVNFFIFLCLAIVLLYFAFRHVDFNHVREGFRNVNYWWIALSAIVGLFSHAVRSYRWGLLIEPISTKPPFSNIFSAVLIGYLANTAFPRLGEVVKCGSITKSDGVRFDSLLGTVVVERAFDLFMTLIITVLVFFAQIEVFGMFIKNSVLVPLHNKLLTIKLIHIFLIAGIFLLLIFLFIFLIKKRLLGARFNQKLKTILRGVGDGLKSIVRTRRLPAFLLSTLLLWTCYWLMTWLLFFSTPITGGLSMLDGLFIMIIGTYGMVMPVQGGFGSYHIIVAVALGIYGISYDNGLIFAIISHELQTLLIVVGGLLALVYQYFKQRKKLQIADCQQNTVI